MDRKMDLDTTDSQHRGLKGFFEKILRRFKVLMHLLIMLPIYMIAGLVLGTCLIPGISLVRFFASLTAEQSAFVQNMGYAFSIAFGYFIYGFCMIFITPLVNFIFRAKLAAWRGPYYSVESLKWFIHNGLTYLVRFTFLEFVTPSPFNILFYQMMGMKIGRGVTINTTFISDPSLIQLGDKVTLGGSVTIVAHYGQNGILIIAPVKIGSGCTVGIKATIMGGVEIGEGAKILPHSVVLPKTIIPAGETWGGVPAQKIETVPKTEKLLKAI